jgi:hypothetical protein
MSDIAEQLAKLAEDGTLVHLADPMRLGVVLDGSLEECARLAHRVAELEERLRAIRQTVFPYLRERTPHGELTRRGELACDVEAEADPHPEPEVA